MPTSDIEAARDQLTKQLYVLDSSDIAVSGLVDSLFLQALKEIDLIIQRSPQGPLPVHVGSWGEFEGFQTYYFG